MKARPYVSFIPLHNRGVIRVNADGSTFWKTACVPFVDIVRKTVDKLLGPRGFSCELLQIDDAPLVGAALAAAH